ncbi:dTDP-4-dehydrorhamnose reductase [Phaeocystidibacter marisrubri]|uniref:dTDP-4-dehydrorhamnose reductase n=1 Tax=Phaeocystidibacter marisrubri TaxID=1577780 RepID=A0A6L3ZJ45_9FLAO|nr:dTDP-4-dehydrorhamnose reductase [Phaeocystidibacter marisrubri]KAB2817578.1 dTDP-4-dehydrorhamnose reductase [Phaeocystidibacter marisrubri]GGH74654.1 NAD(P)-dependent oxidoreductase [Phaeocystidibacter marisrubri]
MGMKVWVTGGAGQLGKCVAATLPVGVDAVFTSRNDVDLSETTAIVDFIEKEGITHLVNTAAYTAVDRAEDEPGAAEYGNVQLVENLAKACKIKEVTFLHVSTDFVYGGPVDGLRKESDHPHPTGVYGETKLRGEHVLASSGVNFIILRTSWLYSDLNQNFFNTMKRLLGEGRDLKVVADQIGSPTLAYDLANFIWFLLSNEEIRKQHLNSIINFSNEGVASWYDFALAIKEECNLSGSITPCTTEEFPTKAQRPFFSKMDLQKVRSTGFVNRHWREALRAVPTPSTGS